MLRMHLQAACELEIGDLLFLHGYFTQVSLI